MQHLFNEYKPLTTKIVDFQATNFYLLLHEKLHHA